MVLIYEFKFLFVKSIDHSGVCLVIFGHRF